VVYGRCEASGDAHRYRRGADRDGAGQRAGVAAVSVGGGDMKPRCKLCLERHWSYESHVFSAEIRTPKPWPKQPLSPAGVTKIDISTTPTVTKIGEAVTKITKISARVQLKSAVRNGAIQRQPCEACGQGNAEGHHDDYSRPLEVRWLCRPCHNAIHLGKRGRPKRYENNAARQRAYRQRKGAT